MIEPKPYPVPVEDGFTLASYCYEPSIAVKGQVIVCGAMGVKQEFYKHFAIFLASKGLRVYTFDYRGIGASKPNSLKGFESSLYDWAVLDLKAMVHFVRDKAVDLPLFAVGHSVGGQLLGLSSVAHEWDGVVTVASQSGYWKHWSGLERVKIWAVWHLIMPSLTHMFGYLPAKKIGLFENLPKHVALQWAQWGRHPQYMRGYYDKAYFEQIRCAVRGYSFSDDTNFAPKPAVDWLHKQFTNATVERLHIQPRDMAVRKIGHFNFFRTTFEASFWEDTITFFQGLTIPSME